VRLRLCAPTATEDLVVQLGISQSLDTVGLLTTGDNLGATPELDLGPLTDAVILVLDVGLAEVKSSRAFVLGFNKIEKLKLDANWTECHIN